MVATELFVPKFHFRIAYVVLIPLTCIFWLSAWAWAAQWASALGDYNWYGGRDNWYNKYFGSMAAGAALGAFTW